MKKRIVIIGAGGHGKVVAETVLLSNVYSIAGFIDDQRNIGDTVYRDIKVLGSRAFLAEHKNEFDGFIAAVGNNPVRKEIFEMFHESISPITVIHPFSFISDSAVIGAGTAVLAGAVIGADAVVGENCIVNAKSLVEHDCVLGAHSHIAQGALAGSGCRMPELFLLEFGGRLNPYTNLIK